MNSCLVDINVWLALSLSSHTQYHVAADWFNQLSSQACFCRPTQLGLLRLLTNARITGPDVKTQIEAWRVYDSLFADQRVSFVYEPRGLEPLLRELTQTRNSAPNTWSDAYLGALASALDLHIVSFDSVFRSMPGVEATILESR